MLNNVNVVGRLTKDPDLRYTPSGTAVTRVTIACRRNFKNSQTGEYESDFIQVQIWRKDAENTANYMKKGDIFGVNGRIQTGRYEGQDGKMVYTTEVVANSVQFIHSQNRQNGGQGGGNYQQNNQQGNYNQQQGGQQGSQVNNYQQNQQANQGNQYNQQQQNFSQQNGKVTNNDPFSSSGNIEISDDDLPF